MQMGLRARGGRVHTTPKARGIKLNGVELLMFGLIAVALVDCTVIGWLVAFGLGN